MSLNISKVFDWISVDIEHSLECKRFSVGMDDLDQNMKALQNFPLAIIPNSSTLNQERISTDVLLRGPLMDLANLLDYWGLWGWRASELESTAITQSGNSPRLMDSLSSITNWYHHKWYLFVAFANFGSEYHSALWPFCPWANKIIKGQK